MSDPKPIDKMTLAELRDYAAAIGVELPGKSKAAAVEAIRAALPAEPAAQLVDFPQPVLDVLERHALDAARVRFARVEYDQLAVGYADARGTLVGYRLALTGDELAALAEATA